MGADSRKREAISVWQFLAMDEDELKRADLVAINLAVARGIPALNDLDVSRYCRIVDGWTRQFAAELPRLERIFHAAPERWKDDIRFMRVGMLAGFITGELGIAYIEEQRHVTSVQYTNPSDLFINGLIDTKRGTCGSLPTLHAAMSRRLGWPVSLACAKSHFLSRFDDGQVVHNIEYNGSKAGVFSSDPDDFYIEKFGLPRRAVECGSDLRRLTTREMIGAFLALRGRHYSDTGRWLYADQDFALSRALFPTHRRTFLASAYPMGRRGAMLFDPDEDGHPNSFANEIASAGQHRLARVECKHSTVPAGGNGGRHVDVHVVNVPLVSHPFYRVR